jgi:phosphate transport system substrate-binding protein
MPDSISGEIQMYANKNNDMAVSPIVATLVLIVVAVIGAVAVGTIMGTFSTDVSKQTNAQGAATASSTHILVAGSTTVQPASILLAQDYEKAHQGIQIDVQGGGSGAGISAVGQGIADIGASSSALTAANMATYPDLQPYQIGARAVVWIVNSQNQVATNVKQADLKTFVNGLAGSTLTTTPAAAPAIDTLVQRSDASGTESTAASYAGATGSGDNAFDNVLITTKPMSGNPGVVAEIQGNAAGNEIGFADLGYIYDASGALKSTASNVRVLTLDGYTYTTGTGLRADALVAAKGKIAGTTQVVNGYPQKLTSQLLYITNGNPSSIVKDFIKFAQSPNGGLDVQAAGDFANSEL